MKRLFLIVLSLLVALLSCERVEPEPEENPLKSLSLTTKQSAYAKAGNQFDFHFIHQLSAQEPGDWFVSPFGTQLVLGMLLNGARGETAEEIYKVLGYGEGDTDAVNEYNYALLQQLPFLDKKVRLLYANAVFADRRTNIKPLYRSTVGHYYKASVENLDFSKSSSLKKINDWAKQQTEGLIPEILDKETMQEMQDDAAVLMSALYFKGEWKWKFQPENTSEEVFHLASGGEKKIPMMKMEKNQKHLFRCGSTEYGDFVEIQFGTSNPLSSAFSVNIILPDKKYSLPAIIEMLDTQSLWEMFQSEHRAMMLEVWIPRIELEYSVDLKDILSKMGMDRAFDPNSADFKDMAAEVREVRSIRQKATINLNETGVEAATIPYLRMAASGMYDDGIFHADRPFLYLITENSTGIILFAGAYTGENQ